MERGNLEVASVRADLQDKTALARIGAAEDIAGPVVFLVGWQPLRHWAVVERGRWDHLQLIRG